MNEHLSKIYYDPKHPASFSNVQKLWLACDKLYSQSLIKNWLMQQECYTRHKPRLKKFPRKSYIVDNIDDLWEIDLMVFENQQLKRNNSGICYILGKKKIKLLLTFFAQWIFVFF